MRDVTLSELERLGDGAESVEVTFHIDEEAFRSFYERTARPVWTYLSHATGDRKLADDLLQEAYYRFLRAAGTFDSDAHRRNYLFRIAVNLVRDHQRRPRLEPLPEVEDGRHPTPSSAGDAAGRAVARIDLSRAMARLTQRERDLLWLAYAHGSSHEEIATSLGLKAASIKSLLFRARRRLASILKKGAPAGERRD
jgi:RNA polymerase sigma-70 factor (ECF subfamily)